MSREAIGQALEAASAGQATHHDERCPKCRQTLKISVEQLKRAAPGWKSSGETNAPGNQVPAPSAEESPKTAPLPTPESPQSKAKKTAKKPSKSK